jgi:hypothetical protein
MAGHISILPLYVHSHKISHISPRSPNTNNSKRHYPIPLGFNFLGQVQAAILVTLIWVHNEAFKRRLNSDRARVDQQTQTTWIWIIVGALQPRR